MISGLLCNATLLRSSGQWDSFTAGEQWAVGFLRCTTTMLGSSGHWDSFSTLPHCSGVVDSGTPPMHRSANRGQQPPKGTGPQAWETCPTELAVTTYGALVGRSAPQKARGHGSRGRSVPPCPWLHVSKRQRGMVAPKRRGVTGWRDGMPYPASGRTVWSARGDLVAPKRRWVTGWGTGCPT